MTVREAVVDDTQRLWIAFADGIWLWVDLAGYLDNYETVGPLPLLPLQDGLDLWLTPDIELPLPLLFWPREAALERGVYVCAASQSFTSWYRPLHLTRSVGFTQPHRPAEWLEGLLRVTPEELQQAASAHIVSLPIFVRRLADLCTFLQNAGQQVAEVLQSPQPFLQRPGSAVTLWSVIGRGQIGLAEQLTVAKVWQTVVQPSVDARRTQ